jgi:hypothetical protein
MNLKARQIKLNSIEIKNDNTLIYHYEAGSFISRFLTQQPLWVKYDGSVKDIPAGIAAIPFLGFISQIIWFYNGILYIPELDAAYAESMNKVKAVYKEIYPKARLSGTINIGRKTSTAPHGNSRDAIFFTGGVDSLSTALHHRHKNPLLISIWGSEQRVNQGKAWNAVSTSQMEAARMLGLKRTVIVSNFRDIMNQWVLEPYFPANLKRSWYVEIAYGSIFLGLSAPLAWREGIGLSRISSSYTAGNIPDGADPELIRNTYWSDTKAFYDGEHEERQEKLENITTAMRDHFPDLKLNVCTLAKDDGNCSLCEKCCRTMAGLALTGTDPRQHGFVVNQDTPFRIRDAMEKSQWKDSYAWQLSNIQFWQEIQKRIPSHIDKALPQWQDFFNWLSGIDLDKVFSKYPSPYWNKIKKVFKRYLPLTLYNAIRGSRIKLKKLQSLSQKA